MFHKIVNKIIHIYYKVYTVLVIYPIISYIISLVLFNLIINSYSLTMDNAMIAVTFDKEQITVFTQLQLPPLTVINEFFHYKTHFLHQTTNLLFHKNITTFPYEKPLSLFELVSITTPTFPEARKENFAMLSKESFVPLSIEKELPLNKAPNTFMGDIEKIPSFEVKSPSLVLDETKVEPPPLIRNDLPFEASIIITVALDETSLTTATGLNDIGRAIGIPSYDGVRVVTEDQVFNLHLDLIRQIKQRLSTMDVVNREILQAILRTQTSDYLQTHFGNMTMKDLRNVNFIINLLVQELIINSLFIDQADEKLIMREVTIALIVESLSLVQKMDPTKYYSDPVMMQMLINSIIPRFNTHWDWSSN